MTKAIKKAIQNERGIITVDYLFAFVLVMGFGGILFALTLTLSVVEITQYITFATARSYSAAHINQQQQLDLALAKHQELVNNPVFAPLYQNGWFEVSDPIVRDMTGIFPGYEADPATGVNLFEGAGVTFQANMLDFRIPFYGSTVNDDTEQGFRSFIASYLSREVTASECQSFQNNRWNAIKNLDLPSDVAPYSQATTANANPYLSIYDNGC